MNVTKQLCHYFFSLQITHADILKLLNSHGESKMSQVSVQIHFFTLVRICFSISIKIRSFFWYLISLIKSSFLFGSFFRKKFRHNFIQYQIINNCVGFFKTFSQQCIHMRIEYIFHLKKSILFENVKRWGKNACNYAQTDTVIKAFN